ncbi:lipase family protein [Vibrio sp. RC27]
MAVSFDNKFNFLGALPLAKLACLMYSQEEMVKTTLARHYDFDTYYYHSTASHKGMLSRGFLHQLYVYFKGKKSVVDLQFLYLSKIDKQTNKRLIVVVFQGSNKPQDWMTNATFQGVDFLSRGRVHQGFYGAFKLFFRSLKSKKARSNNLMLSQLLKDVKTLNETTNIVFVGHSLGGALATLASCYLHELGVNPDIMKVYSFGAPPIGTKEFSDYFSDKIAINRVVNDLDVVPKFDSIINLYHVGEPIVMPSNENEIHSCDGYVDNIIDAIQAQQDEGLSR